MSRYNPRRKNKAKRPYTGSKAIDPSCRSHGSCPYCEAKRKYKLEKLGAISSISLDLEIAQYINEHLFELFD